MIKIEFANEQSLHKIDKKRLVQAARMILEAEGPPRVTLSLAVVDDPTIHRLNVRYLEHDYPTDVLSFVLESDEQMLDGEVVVSADTAALLARDYGWKTDDELLLYVIHGVLHLVGYDDKQPARRREMRAKEREYLSRFDLPHRYDDDSED